MAYPNEQDTVGFEKPEMRNVGQKRRTREVATGTTGGTSLGEGAPIVAFVGRPIRTRRDDLIDASRARRGGRAGATYPGGGLLDRAGLGSHAGRRAAPARER